MKYLTGTIQLIEVKPVYKHCLRAVVKVDGKQRSVDIGDRLNGHEIKRVALESRVYPHHSIGILPEGQPFTRGNVVDIEAGEFIN